MRMSLLEDGAIKDEPQIVMLGTLQTAAIPPLHVNDAVSFALANEQIAFDLERNIAMLCLRCSHLYLAPTGTPIANLSDGSGPT